MEYTAEHKAKLASSLYAISDYVKQLGEQHVIVALSGGKESLVTLDLCCKRFQKVTCYYLYYVQGLSFREKIFSYLRKRYEANGLDIFQLPSPALPHYLRSGQFRYETAASKRARNFGFRDIENYVRSKTGARFVATGEKILDSMHRQAQIKSHGGVDFDRMRFYPVAHWKESQVFNYLKINRIHLPSDYALMENVKTSGSRTHNFAVFSAEALVKVREKYPEDWEKIVEQFPGIGSMTFRFENIDSRDHIKTVEKPKPEKQVDLEDAEQASDS